MTDINTRIARGDYVNKVPYLFKANYEKFYVYSQGKVIVDGLVILDHDERDTKRAEWKAAGYTAELITDRDGMKAARQAYQEENNRLELKFRADLEADYDMTGHPKADLLFQKAWDQGHSSGYAEVANTYDDLYELVK